MELLSHAGALASTCLTGLIVAVGASEFSACAPFWAKRIIHRAAQLLPEEERIDSEAEWLAHLDDIPGNVSKILHACGLLSTAIVARASLKRPDIKRPAAAAAGLETTLKPALTRHRWLYPIDWHELSASIRFRRAKGRCEGCGRPHGRMVVHLGDGRWWDEEAHRWRNGDGKTIRHLKPPHSLSKPTRTTRVVLAAVHLDHDPTNNDASNLAALCQRCHILYDREGRLYGRRLTYLARRALGDLFMGPYDR